MDRRILHVDMDAFFASIEAVLNPALKGKPVVVGGSPDNARGVVSSASYEARKFGVRSAMPVAQAMKLCPQGVFLRGTYGAYGQVSERIRLLLESITPVHQMASIDEANLDITGSLRLFGGEDAIAKRLKGLILDQEGLTCAIGIASNKLVAKIAANECKPNGYLNVPAGAESSFLRPLAVEKLPGVGPHAREALHALGIHSIGQLADTPLSSLRRIFSEQGAAGLWRAAQGYGGEEIQDHGPPKSISREITFPKDLFDWREIYPVICCLAEHCAYTLRREAMETRRVTLKVRHSDFKTQTFSHMLPEPTALDVEIIAALHALLPKAKARRARIRLVGVNLSSLTHNQHQLRLFGQAQTEKWERTFQAVDKVRERMGFEAIRLGSAQNVEQTSPKKQGPTQR